MSDWSVILSARYCKYCQFIVYHWPGVKLLSVIISLISMFISSSLPDDIAQ